ncbi:hypothetical protein [Aquimarina agarivorans]|uniref:hypothetical protein n=1 Tax=Aquimarina agarivorans TaxID=980584 RepID=UPI000248EBEA|nr:hypothetical protein [Aquimarina agarivorans]
MKTKILVCSLFLFSFFGYSQIASEITEFGNTGVKSFLFFRSEPRDSGSYQNGMFFFDDKGGAKFYIGQRGGPNTESALSIWQTLAGKAGIHLKKDTIEFQGKIGIGTDDPQNELSVNGTIWAQEVIVSLKDGADWVFEEDYNLKPLAEVEAFIKRNKHLPEMPSADDFRANDMKVSEMTNRLLQKIEELTLYTIEQEKKLEELEVLKVRLAKLEALLVK